jgi:hypothetical protein
VSVQVASTPQDENTFVKNVNFNVQSVIMKASICHKVYATIYFAKLNYGKSISPVNMKLLIVNMVNTTESDRAWQTRGNA